MILYYDISYSMIAYDISCNYCLDGVVGSQQAGGPLSDIYKEWV
jgi:hypothetical protein